MVSISIKTAIIAVAVLATSTEAHNKMTLPVPTWPSGFYSQNNPSGTIDPTVVLPVPSGMSYNTDSTSNSNAYWTAFNASKYTSLKELAWDSQTLADGASNECGFSVVDGTAQDLPEKVQWDFFTASHQGPCEVWCDDTLVFEDWNCAVTYPETPASLPYTKAKCEGSAVLSSYWIALHTTPWQIYTNCAPLTGGSASTTNSSTTETTSATTTKTPSTTTKTPTSAPTATTAAPSVTTAAQTTTTSTEASAEEETESSTTSTEASTDADVTEGPATTEAPAAMEAPTATTLAPSTDKCSVRRRRH